MNVKYILPKFQTWGFNVHNAWETAASAPQPTEKEDSSSSPSGVRKATNLDGLNIRNMKFSAISDSDEKEICISPIKPTLRIGTLESDSVNEAFSPSRFFKPSSRKKRKLKRVTMDCHLGPFQSQDVSVGTSSTIADKMGACGTVRKRVLKSDPINRNNLFFCGKRKRSNRDRYQDYDQRQSHSSSIYRFNNIEENIIRPRSYSSTSKPNSDRLLPLNKGLLSKIEKISQLQKPDREPKFTTSMLPNTEPSIIPGSIHVDHQDMKSIRKSRMASRQAGLQLQFPVDQHPMDCGTLNEFLSSSSLSSSDSDDDQAINDTDREGDDELTDWPGNESISGVSETKTDCKRKLTKKSNSSGFKSDESSLNAIMVEDDTIMHGSEDWSPNVSSDNMELRYRSSEPIIILNKPLDLGRSICNAHCNDATIPFKQIESEMSGETSNTFLSSPPSQLSEIREIRAGCRRIKDERPGFSIKTSVNERFARFLQDPRQVQIRLPDIEIYEHNNLLNLATLYSLQLTLTNECAVLEKTSNTTQSVNIDQNSLQNCLLSDFKRRCYGSKNDVLPRK